ncbi:MAG: hypothetical protein U0528_01570 [Anaerolineae bacterium]
MPLTIFVAALALTAAAIGVARLQQQTNPMFSFGFDSCHDKPCFFGITPGVTAWAEARTILQTRWHGAAVESVSSGTQKITVNYGDGGTLLWVESDRREQRVRRIIWVVQDSTCCPTLANVLAIYNQVCGEIDWRRQMRYRGSTQLRYMTANTRRSVDSHNSPMFTKVYSITLTADLQWVCR